MNNRTGEPHGHQHGNPQPAWWKQAHRDWRTWVVVALMLAAMGIYVLSMDESLQPGRPAQPAVPVAP